MKSALTICIIFLLTGNSFAEIYKSVDEDGKVTFSQIPPSNDAPEYKVKIHKGAESHSPGLDQKNISSADRQKRYLNYLTQERLERKEKREEKKQQKAELRNNCKRVRYELEDLNQAGSRYYDLDENGNRVVIGYERIQARKDQLSDFLRKNCSDV